MNAPRGRPDSEWISQVRATNRARSGAPSVPNLGQVPRREGVTWKTVAFLALIGLVAYSLLPR